MRRRCAVVRRGSDHVRVVRHHHQDRAVDLLAVRGRELEVEGLGLPPEHLRQQRLRGLDLGVAVRVLLHDRRVDTEGHVVHEEPIADGRVVDAPLDGVPERVHRLSRIVAVESEIECEVVPCPRADADEREVVLDGDGRDERLRSVAAGHAEAVGAAGDGVPGELLEVEARGRAAPSRHRARGRHRGGRTARPCHRPTTGCTAGPGTSAATPASPVTWMRWRSRTIAARAHTNASPRSPTTMTRRTISRSLPLTARVKLQTIATTPTTTPAMPIARRGMRSVMTHHPPATAMESPISAISRLQPLLNRKIRTNATTALNASSAASARSRRRSETAFGRASLSAALGLMFSPLRSPRGRTRRWGRSGRGGSSRRARSAAIRSWSRVRISDERHVDTRRVELDVQLGEHVRRGDVDVGDGFALDHDPRRLPLAHEVADLFAEDTARSRRTAAPPIGTRRRPGAPVHRGTRSGCAIRPCRRPGRRPRRGATSSVGRTSTRPGGWRRRCRPGPRG